MNKADIRKIVTRFQRNEITEHILYKELSNIIKGKNGDLLKNISDDELRHYGMWKEYTNIEIHPNKFKIFIYMMIAKIFGLTFVIKMLEENEELAQDVYLKIVKEFPKAKAIIKDEEKHEDILIGMIEEEKINYIGSMVLGLNDALVELTGALAGLTFALKNTRLVGVAGFITGFSASLSMAASEYLSQKSEKGEKSPLKASVYTGLAYIATVLLLIFPYFIFQSYYYAISLTLVNGVFVVLVFTFFVSVVKGIPFIKLFFEMLFISMGVAVLSFFIGILTRKLINVDI